MRSVIDHIAHSLLDPIACWLNGLLGLNDRRLIAFSSEDRTAEAFPLLKIEVHATHAQHSCDRCIFLLSIHATVSFPCETSSRWGVAPAQPIEVFAGRDAIAVAAWMRAHPSIEIVARDRAGAYSEAVDLALPAAKQVSDRWHLLSNLRDNVERLLYRLGPQMRQAAQQVNVSRVTLGRQGLRRSSQRSWERLSAQRRAKRLALYKQVMALRAQGGTIRGIARELSISAATVQKYVKAGAFPERAPRARGPTPLDRQGIPRRNSQRSWERLSDQRRASRLALYKQLMALRAQGGTIRGIARELSISAATVNCSNRSTYS
ncbi:transposase [Cupriavidus pinatubonensis]|uniref:Transposase IS204/IS1001/IS1096/IS1165 DDE domain-containing protein n=1 Tax=Cupriavidus pinatubonensis TaxID=248026 RepID=A0ABN7Y072_9BURK|nr:transposase [Cupriavidus pinatubonensis]CAG9165841.1 hypothetical protein LMG23994_00834 [Cupriavidus pinatubonensis]